VRAHKRRALEKVYQIEKRGCIIIIRKGPYEVAVEAMKALNNEPIIPYIWISRAKAEGWLLMIGNKNRRRRRIDQNQIKNPAKSTSGRDGTLTGSTFLQG
jgi:hypothetical protein